MALIKIKQKLRRYIIPLIIVFIVGFPIYIDRALGDEINPGDNFYAIEQFGEALGVTLDHNFFSAINVDILHTASSKIASEALAEAAVAATRQDTAQVERLVEKAENAFLDSTRDRPNIRKEQTKQQAKNMAIDVLTNIKTGLPEQAQKGLDNAIRNVLKNKEGKRDPEMRDPPLIISFPRDIIPRALGGVRIPQLDSMVPLMKSTSGQQLAADIFGQENVFIQTGYPEGFRDFFIEINNNKVGTVNLLKEQRLQGLSEDATIEVKLTLVDSNDILAKWLSIPITSANIDEFYRDLGLLD